MSLDVLAGTDARAALDDAHAAAWAAVDSDLLGLCRDRIAMLLRHPPTIAAMSAARSALVADWPSAPQLSDLDRAALAFTEQYIVDVTGITDGLAAALRAHLGDEGVSTFVNAILVLEQRMTLELALAVTL